MCRLCRKNQHVTNFFLGWELITLNLPHHIYKMCIFSIVMDVEWQWAVFIDWPCTHHGPRWHQHQDLSSAPVYQPWCEPNNEKMCDCRCWWSSLSFTSLSPLCHTVAQQLGNGPMAPHMLYNTQFMLPIFYSFWFILGRFESFNTSFSASYSCMLKVKACRARICFQ